MTASFLSKIPFLGKFVDERFLEHRRRSSLVGMMAGVLLGAGLLEYRIFHDHIINWDLLAVLSTIARVKVAMMIWYRLNV